MAADPGVASAAEKRPLDDVMLAMDVVDTLRHRASLVERELMTEDRDKRLIERLRAIYAAQGIEVPDDVLAEGVAAMKEERFKYAPPPSSFQVTLARWYVHRDRWLPWVSALCVALLALVAAVYFLRIAPEQRLRKQLPALLVNASNSIAAEAKQPALKEKAAEIEEIGQRALKQGNIAAAKDALASLEDLRSRMQEEFELRIVQSGSTGVWRIPDLNPNARNYYLIVEPVAPDGRILEVPVLNEEDGKIRTVSKWGLRVSEETFNKVRRDKQDDGIIQDNRFGVKKRGQLDPEYLMPTTGAAITNW